MHIRIEHCTSGDRHHLSACEHPPKICIMPHYLGYLSEQLGQFQLKRCFNKSSGRSSPQGPLSWFRRWKEGPHLPAPCRRGRWRSASARGQCNPHGRCEGRAGTEWDRRNQNPSCRSHTWRKQRLTDPLSNRIKIYTQLYYTILRIDQCWFPPFSVLPTADWTCHEAKLKPV